MALVLPRRYNQTGIPKSLRDDLDSGINASPTNDEILKKLTYLRSVPSKEHEAVRKLLTQQLTPKELELDEELTSFLNEYKNLQEHTGSASSSPSSSSLHENNNNIKDSYARKSHSPTSATIPFPFLKSFTKEDEPYSPQELYLRQLNHAKNSAFLGAQIKGTYQPYMDISNPPSIEETTIRKLMAANVHLGQSTSIYRPSTQKYIYGEYKGLHIIDLAQTLQCLRRACSVVEGVAENGGLILLLGTKPEWKVPLQAAARRMNSYFVSTRWIPGTLTNPTELSRIWGKQEIDQYDIPTRRQLTNDEMSCIVKPDLLVVLNPTENRNALYEAMKTRVPTIGIIDTDSEPSLVTYPIPGNDDSHRSVSLILGILSKAGARGLSNRLRDYTKLKITAQE